MESKIITKFGSSDQSETFYLKLVNDDLVLIQDGNGEDIMLINREIHEKIESLFEDVIQIQDLSDDTIEKIIIEYLERHKGEIVYPSDIAFAFNLDAKKVFKISQKMKRE